MSRWRRFDEALSEQRDEHGRIILGSQDPCCYCGADAVATISQAGPGVIWWHAPANCCPERRKRMKKANDAARADYDRQDEPEAWWKA